MLVVARLAYEVQLPTGHFWLERVTLLVTLSKTSKYFSALSHSRMRCMKNGDVNKKNILGVYSCKMNQEACLIHWEGRQGRIMFLFFSCGLISWGRSIHLRLEQWVFWFNCCCIYQTREKKKTYLNCWYSSKAILLFCYMMHHWHSFRDLCRSVWTQDKKQHSLLSAETEFSSKARMVCKSLPFGQLSTVLLDCSTFSSHLLYNHLRANVWP